MRFRYLVNGYRHEIDVSRIKNENNETIKQLIFLDKETILETVFTESALIGVLNMACASDFAGFELLEHSAFVSRPKGDDGCLNLYIFGRKWDSSILRWADLLSKRLSGGVDINIYPVKPVESKDVFITTRGKWAGDAVPDFNISLSEHIGLIGGYERCFQASKKVLDDDRRERLWNSLNNICGDSVIDGYLLNRIFKNYLESSFQGYCVDIDGLVLHDGRPYILECKHKYPFGGGRNYVGLNSAPAKVFNVFAHNGVPCLYFNLLSPFNSKNKSPGYLAAHNSQERKYVLISLSILEASLMEKVCGMSVGHAPSDTSTKANKEIQHFKIDLCTEAMYVGMLDNGGEVIANNLSKILSRSDEAQFIGRRVLLELRLNYLKEYFQAKADKDIVKAVVEGWQGTKERDRKYLYKHKGMIDTCINLSNNIDMAILSPRQSKWCLDILTDMKWDPADEAGY